MPRGKKEDLDPMRNKVLSVVRKLAKENTTNLSVQQYMEWRKEKDPTLPALTTVYRMFNSWGDLLAEAGISQPDEERKRTSDQELVAALQAVAVALGVKVLSSHMYDEQRRRMEQKLPSSSVIRKWLGPWEIAVQRADLEAPKRATPRKVTTAEVLHSLRVATRRSREALTPQIYAKLMSDADEEEEWPDLMQIMSLFPSWETALRAADIEIADDLHPHALWTVEEARRTLNLVAQLLNGPVDGGLYEDIRKRAKRPMPTWETICELLGIKA